MITSSDKKYGIPRKHNSQELFAFPKIYPPPPSERETSHKKSREGYINTSKVITLLSLHLHLEIQDNK